MDKMTDSRAVEAQAQGDRLAIKLLVASGYVTEAKANEALNIAHGFDKGPLAPPSAPVGVDARVSALQSTRDRLMAALPSKFGDAFDGDFDVMLEAINTMKRFRTATLAQQPASDGGFTAADIMDARQEGRKEAQQPAAVDGAMVERALAAYLRRQDDGESLYGCVTAALTAALHPTAAQENDDA